MNLFNEFLPKLKSGEYRLSVIGLGYVGLPIAHAFAKKGIYVVGFDINSKKIDKYLSGVDFTKEIGDDEIRNTQICFSSNECDLQTARFHIIAVPTPINADHTPDLSSIIGASKTVGRNLKKGSVVVYESTVYPGCTEDLCIDILEQESGLKCGIDFLVGYSPERINPGDKIHRLENIKKIVSGINELALQIIKSVYDIVIEVGTYPVSNIRTAEAIKVVENSQRDINIAFMNELAMVFDKMDIDTNEVVDGMNTKWNALGFRPGLVGGHCIGVDPYYFTYEAEKLGYHSQIILSGRIVNDSMGEYVADTAVKKMVEAGLAPLSCKVAIMGFTFKENCPDIRNNKTWDIVKKLKEYGIEPLIYDPWANDDEAISNYNIRLVDETELHDIDCIILAVSHDIFKEIDIDKLKKYYRNMDSEKKKVLIDVKGVYAVKELEKSGLLWWRL